MRVELEARAEEVGLTAYATMSAIADAFGAKGAIKKLLRSLRPAGDGDGGSQMIRTLKRRLGAAIKVQDTKTGEELK